MKQKFFVLFTWIVTLIHLHASQVAQQKIQIDFTREQKATLKQSIETVFDKNVECTHETYEIFVAQWNYIRATRIINGPREGSIDGHFYTMNVNCSVTRKPLVDSEQYFYALKKLYEEAYSQPKATFTIHEKYHITKKQQ